MRRFAVILVLAAAWSLSACTPGVISSDERGVAVENLSRIGHLNPTLARHYSSEALIVADDHCRQFGRYARLKREEAARISFECVD